ncbi:MAG TPA: TldD/PmbA family protein [Caulobacteraceae bacterium]|jgi:PmbA protein|nr:TldD/PmbA family protein [Caulobacteraceae bacterium]
MDEALLHDLVQSALRAGADAAEAVTQDIRSLSVGVRMGELEEVEREERRDLGLRVFIGRRQAVVSSSDLSPEVRTRLVERAVAMARLAPEDPYCGLAPKDRLAKGDGPDLELYDPAELSPEALEQAARTAEAAARSVEGVANSEGGSASWSAAAGRIVTSDGFSGFSQASGFSISASAIAEDENGMERGGEGRSTRHLADLPSPETIGTDAGLRAVSRLGARKIDSCTATVLFENRGSTQVLSPFVGAISGSAVARGVSFLKDKLGAQVFARGVNVVDDPLRIRGLGSAFFDDEGVATARRALIEDGVLTTWLLNSGAARQLGMETTGHASRGLADAPGVSTHNFTLEPGAASPAELMRDAGQGLFVTSMFGPSLNSNNGDWSAGVSGFWFENGELAYPVTEITVAGNLIELYARLIPANDLEIRGSSNAPSLLIDGLAVAGR